jgi:hypothetical protein
MKRTYIVLLLLTLIFTSAFSQAGQYIYTFLEMPVSSHINALGGANVALRTNDINFALENPALLTSETDKQLALNFTNYLADASVGSAAFGKNWKENMFAAAIQYVDYGMFEARSETNEVLGNFTAKDVALSLMYARQLEKYWQGGVCIKPIYSAYESYTSFGIGVDVGISYAREDKGLYLGLALQNIGTQLVSYNKELEYFPFNSMVSFSKKFKHAPIRVHVTAHHLHYWHLDYTNNVYTTTLSGAKTYDTISFVDMLFRHSILAIDIIPTKNMYVTVSYNHRRAAELRLLGLKTIAGFSFGGGLKVYKFHLGFAASQYQKGIMTYQFSLNTNLDWVKKKHVKTEEDNSSN